MAILKNLTGILLTAIVLSGCGNSLKSVKVMNEDKRAATVSVGYIHKVPKHRPNQPLDMVDKTNSIAAQYCQKNGYKEAKRLGNTNEDCVGHAGSVNRWCNKYEVTFKYQCM